MRCNYQYTANSACRKCLHRLPGLSGSPAANSTSTGQPQRKPAGQIYSISGAVRSAVVDQQIGDDAVTIHQRLVGKSRTSTAALDQANLTLSLYMTCSGTSSQCSVKKPWQASLELLRAGDHSSQLVCRRFRRIRQESLTVNWHLHLRSIPCIFSLILNVIVANAKKLHTKLWPRLSGSQLTQYALRAIGLMQPSFKLSFRQKSWRFQNISNSRNYKETFHQRTFLNAKVCICNACTLGD